MVNDKPSTRMTQLDAPGLIAGITGVTRNLAALVSNRVELAALEFSELRSNLVKLLIVAAVGAITAFFAFTYFTVMIVALFWDALGWKILLIMTILFAVATMAVYLYARSLLGEGKLSMPATMAELGRDRDALL
ncbi:MAG: hypothetical protein NVSMB6_06910 [Burkholderiaceae bacterium]